MQSEESTVEERFGAAVLSRRQSLGWTQRMLAARLESVGLPVDASAVSRIENGTRALRLSEAVIFAQVLGLQIADLIGEQSSPEVDFERQHRLLEQATRVARDQLIEVTRLARQAYQTLWDHPEAALILGEVAFDYQIDNADNYIELIKLDQEREAPPVPFGDPSDSAITELLLGIADAVAPLSHARWASERPELRGQQKSVSGKPTPEPPAERTERR